MAAAVVASTAGGAADSGGAEDTAEATGAAAAGSLRIDSGRRDRGAARAGCAVVPGSFGDDDGQPPRVYDKSQGGHLFTKGI